MLYFNYTRIAVSVLAAACLSMSAAYSSDVCKETNVTAGVNYKEITRTVQDGKNIAIYVLSIDRSVKGISYRAMKGQNHVIGTDQVSDMAKRLDVGDGEVIAAINADYYCMTAPYAGESCGILLKKGELMISPTKGWPTFGFDYHGNPIYTMEEFGGSVILGKESCEITKLNRPWHTYTPADSLTLYTPSFSSSTIGKNSDTNTIVTNIKPALPFKVGVKYTGTISEIKKGVSNIEIPYNGIVLCGSGKYAAFLDKNAQKGKKVQFSVKLSPSLKTVCEATGCWPLIVHDGKTGTWEDTDTELVDKKHARTSIGWNDKYIFIVNVDGNNRETGSGMTVQEISEFMQELKCKEAVCMDGGGSTTMVVRGKVMNHPSDRKGERSVSDGWAVVKSK